MLNFCWRDNYKIKCQLPIIFISFGCLLSTELTKQLLHLISSVLRNMGHCKVSEVQENRCWNAMYVIKLPEAQRRTTWGYSCLFISIQYNLEVIIIYRFSWITAKLFYYFLYKLTHKLKKKWKGTFLENLAISKLGYNLKCSSCWKSF